MSGPLVAILGTRFRDLAVEEEVLAPFGARLVTDPGATPADILAVAADADVVLAGSAPKLTADVIAGLRGRGIVRYGVGTDSVDLDAARATARPCALLRRLPEADRVLREGRWGFADLRPLHVPSALTAGVVGFGRIGRQAASYLLGLGFTVVAHDEYVDVPPDTGVRAVDLDTLLAAADAVLLHAPGTPDGAPLLGADRLARMREGSVLVNTARGSLVDVPALVEALRAGRPARAALDVFPQEPADADLFAGVEDKVLLTPHMAWYTEESELDMRRKAAAEAARLLAGEPLRDPVVEPARATSEGSPS